MPELDIESGPRALVSEHGSPLLVLNCDNVRRQYRNLAAALPGVDLHYAMKALPHPAVLAVLKEEGSSFDISSVGEIDLLKNLGVSPAKTIFTHPIKRDKDIRDALEYGCGTFVVDNVAEMEKVVARRDRVSLLLRVGFRSLDAVVDLSKKFGCAPEDAFCLLEVGRKLDLPFCGLAFHVGSQCLSPGAHVDAINDCRALIDRVHRAHLANLRVLDIGGGFPVSYLTKVPSIETFCAPIRKALDTIPTNIRVIAEPGRYIAAPAMQGIATVIGKARRGDSFWYYLDDGVYGSFSGQVFDAARYPLRAIGQNTAPLYSSVLAGPTCDSVDIISGELSLPELQIGDLILGETMGAYTSTGASEFNSLPKTKIIVLNGPAPRKS